MNKLTVKNIKGQNAIDSREIAEMVDKDHSHLLRDIKGYVNILAESKFGLGIGEFFIEDRYKDRNNQNRPCYLLTRKGCDMVANKMTGEKGVLFTAEYVTQFEKMDNAIRNQYQGLTPELQAIFQNDKIYQYLEKKTTEYHNEVSEQIREIKEDSPLFGVEMDELQKAVKKKGIEILGGYKSNAYCNKSLRTKVYADIQVQIKRNFGVNSYKGIKRKNLNKAVGIVKEYKAPLVLKDEITLLNNQQEFNEVI